MLQDIAILTGGQALLCWIRRWSTRSSASVKPIAMLQDALIDLTSRGEIVLDPFLGSGSALIAAENTERVCRGIELDPLYVDAIIRRRLPPHSARSTAVAKRP